MKKYLAEFIGTFTLSLIVLLSLLTPFPLPTPVLAALTLMLFVYTIGPISGAHINPAVTIGLWITGKINAKEALLYVITQVAAGGLIFLLARHFELIHLTEAVKHSWNIVLAEGTGTFLLAFGVAASVHGKVPSIICGIVIGGSLLLGITLAALSGSAGILNPAVALAIDSFNIMYVLGPILGSIAGMSSYSLLLEGRSRKSAGKKK